MQQAGNGVIHAVDLLDDSRIGPLALLSAGLCPRLGQQLGIALNHGKRGAQLVRGIAHTALHALAGFALLVGGASQGLDNRLEVTANQNRHGGTGNHNGDCRNQKQHGEIIASRQLSAFS